MPPFKLERRENSHRAHQAYPLKWRLSKALDVLLLPDAESLDNGSIS